MSLYILIATVLTTVASSIATFITYFWYPQYFATAALIASGSVLFGVMFFGAMYVWILFAEAWLGKGVQIK